MKKSKPPTEVLNRRPGRKSMFDEIAAKLRTDVGVWYDITDELDAQKPAGYLYELARAVTAGNRNSFKPKGAYEGAADETHLWARYLGDPSPAVELPDGADAAVDDTLV